MCGYEPEEYFEVDENFEFNTGINKLLDQEVEKRLSERVKDYEKAIERDEKSQKTISDLKNEIYKLNMELSSAERKFKKAGYDDALRELLGGFKIGDNVWFIKNTYSHENCPLCLGDKKVIAEIKVEELEITCPKCNGYGHMSKTTQSIEKGIIKEIEIHTWANGKKFEERMYIEPISYRASDSVEKRIGSFFKTKEDCEISLNTSKS